MASKASFEVSLRKNTITAKGGAWLLSIYTTNGEAVTKELTAWANVSAAKRYLKTQVLLLTPRKSIKLNSTEFDEVAKPVSFEGSLFYKK